MSLAISDFSTVFTVRENPTQTAHPTSRLLLYKGESIRLDPTTRRVQVLTGRAWLTIQEQDIILSDGDELTIPASERNMVVSAVGRVPLALAVWRG